MKQNPEEVYKKYCEDCIFNKGKNKSSVQCAHNCKQSETKKVELDFECCAAKEKK